MLNFHGLNQKSKLSSSMVYSFLDGAKSLSRSPYAITQGRPLRPYE